jgi:hypothetical protein
MGKFSKKSVFSCVSSANVARFLENFARFWISQKNNDTKVLCMMIALGLELYLPLRSWIIVLNFLTAHALVWLCLALLFSIFV